MLAQPVEAGDVVLVASRSWARTCAISRVHANGLLAVNGELFHQNGRPVSPYSAFELYRCKNTELCDPYALLSTSFLSWEVERTVRRLLRREVRNEAEEDHPA
jgi:hypothetical protein